MKAFIYKYRLELFIILLGFFCMLFFSRYGLDTEDEGWFIYVSKLVSEGFIPYKDFSLHTTPGPYYIQGLIFKLFGSTVMVDRYSMIFLGLFVALARLNRNPILKSLAAGYVYIFRGTPMLIQILFWFNAVPIMFERIYISLPFMAKPIVDLATIDQDLAAGV